MSRRIKALSDNLRSRFPSSLWAVVLVSLVCFGLSVYFRIEQYRTWRKAPQYYFVRESPLMTTLDAYSFLRFAREYRDGTFEREGEDPLRFYPDGAGKPQSLSMLGFLLAKASAFFQGDVYRTGMFLVPWLASLFILPFSVYFFRLGYPAASVVGSFVGTFNFMYYTRTSIGRVDTDLLNLFFPFLASLLILCMPGDRKRVLSVAALCGAVMGLFYWWYPRPVFTVVYFGVMVFYLWINGTDLKTLVGASILYLIPGNGLPLILQGIDLWDKAQAMLPGYGGWVLLAVAAASLGLLWGLRHRIRGLSPGTLLISGLVALGLVGLTYASSVTSNLDRFLSFYLGFDEPAKVAFPSLTETITEARHIPFMEVLSRVIDQSLLGVAGLALFGVMAVVEWRRVIPLTPLLLLGVLSFYSSQRFSMYLAPFVGAGWGYLVTLALSWGFRRISLRWWLREGIMAVVAFLFVFAVSSKTAVSFVPAPSIPVDIYSTFLDLKKKLPENAVLLTWWDFGFALHDVARRATFHDGATQNSRKTYFIARALASMRQEELHGIAAFLAREGERGIGRLVEEKEDARAMLAPIVGYRGPLGDQPVYVLFTRDMIGKFSALSYLGRWDFEAKTSQPRAFRPLRCTSLQGGVLTCEDAVLDLRSGLINKKTPLKKALFIRDGYVVQEQEYSNPRGYYLEIHLKENAIFSVYLLDDIVFRSNFNQMYLLGRADKKLFEEVYNDFPAARVFRVKPLSIEDPPGT